jgi:putative ABC transport system permease protein
MLTMYQMFYALPTFTPHVYPDIIFIGLAIGIVFALLGAVKGVRYAAGLAPAEAICPPPPEKGARILPELIPPLWRLFSFREKMILRAVFRNPFRSTVSILASFIATSLIVYTVSMTDSLDYLMSFEFEMVSHQDVSVSLRDPVGRRVVSEMNQLPTITATEPQLGVPCDLINGPYEKRTGVTGLPANNRLYTPMDKEGRRIVTPSEGLILDAKLAEILHVQPGDLLRLRPLIAHRREVLAPVVGLVDSFLGISAYADLEYLSRLLGEDWTANILMSSSGSGFTHSPLLPEVKRRPTVVGLSERTRSLTQLDETFGETMGAMLFMMVLFAGLIAFGSVLNATLVSLSERRRDVGSLRVMGYAPGQVSGIFSGESYLLNGVGALFGLFGGIGLTHLMATAYNTELYRFPAIVFPIRLVESAIIMFVFITIAQIIIYFSIRRLDWLEAVKIKE